MVGILLVTHSTFSEGIRKSMEFILGGAQDRLDSLALLEGDSVQMLEKKMKERIVALDDGDGVLVLVDLFGGSPGNMAASAIRGQHAECVTGLNLPMLLAALDGRDDTPLEELAETCAHDGREGILSLRKKMPQLYR